MRLIIVANRLPVTTVRRGTTLAFKPSIGGLTTGLNALLRAGNPKGLDDYCWVGWPGLPPAGFDDEALRAALAEMPRYVPVLYSKKLYKDFYSGFCNSCLWPLFHALPTLTTYQEWQWTQYVRANELYLEALAPMLREDDVVWVHDYHLMLLPQMIRQKFPRITIGFFLHIPFPHYEIFRILPSAWRSQLLKGMMGADVVGFHTNDYAQDFLKCILKISGLENKDGLVMTQNRIVAVRNYPMGIAYDDFHRAALETEASGKKNEFLKDFQGQKLILSVDRLDYTKGVVNRLLGYEQFLAKHPEWHQKVSLIMVLAPSRTDVSLYGRMKKEIEMLVGKINGAFGQPHWTPVLYQYQTKSFDELSLLYVTADVALITPLRDGMNLIAKEFVASRSRQNGVLILSELAGASQELIEAKIINPFHIREIADAIDESLNLTEAEQHDAMTRMRRQIKGYDVVRWADDFVGDLTKSRKTMDALRQKMFSRKASEQFLEAFLQSENRLLLVDYDGTLVRFEQFPKQAAPPPRLLETLKRLTECSNTKVVVMSGRDRFTMEKWFDGTGLGFVAENGAWIKDGPAWQMIDSVTADWKPIVLPFIQEYSIRLPGSFLEEKEFSMVWHFRNSDVALSRMRSAELRRDLMPILQEHMLDFSDEIKSVEIRKRGISKDKAVERFLQRRNYDFVAAFGDDYTDEGVFQMIPAHGFTFKVGIEPTHARFMLFDDARVESLLRWVTENIGLEVR
ncbi:trehalose 6-phosphate synthase/phosphatase [Chryseolinea serpens]|uniref:Trehalose 6-phosphate synthase/phosphatase n=1 Tax=Chryseolinea serpens TaxID=947013 RepID=A0A1M5XUW9_9BACT|nr:bifunctional alpha,alpha-trehalose-phosphate synthase (UDP-forming)/trehalose-phosphatase [Chryseolinea serpens]SHI03338.1 trehalose 6-phosphate synthase/phosphatase [Chryseolinea serpens]